jgi:hypothetical protein
VVQFYSVIIYFRCQGDGCVLDIHEDLYSVDLSKFGIIDFFFDSERADILWHSTKSYDVSLAYYLDQLTDSDRAKKGKGLDEIWPVSEPLYLKYDNKQPLTPEKFSSIFEKMAFSYPVPVCFPDLQILSEISNEEYDEYYSDSSV